MGIAVKPLCSTGILFLSLTEMKQRLLSLPVENVLLIMGKEAADWWSLHSFLKEMEDRYQFHWLQTEVANPNQQDVKEALESLGAKPLDAIVAIGGGSVIDLAKAIVRFMIRKEMLLIRQRRLPKPSAGNPTRIGRNL